MNNENVDSSISSQTGGIAFKEGFNDFDTLKNLRKQKHPFGKRIYPINRLLKFINVDSSNKAEVIDFCNKFKYLPSYNLELKKKVRLIDAFKKEQKIVKGVFSNFYNKTLSDKDLRLMEKYFKKGIIHSLRLVDNTYRNRMNNISKNTSIHNQEFDEDFHDIGIEETYTETNSLSGMLYDLKNIINLNNKYHKCKNCSSFFLPSRGAKAHYFCSESCKKSYYKQKKKSLT